MNLQMHTMSASYGQVVGTGLVALDRIHVDEKEPLFEELGGSCGNVLISLAMLGRSVTPLLRLGTDPVGERLERDLRLAGADTKLVWLDEEIRTPVIVEMLDLVSSHHNFSFICPHSLERFGSFEPITPRELELARPAVSSCAVFYADRISVAICDAMEAAADGGAVVYFEPSSISDLDLFGRALAAAHVFKYSADRLNPGVAEWLRPEAFSIVTAGRSGLEVRHGGATYRCEAIDAVVVKDTCGAGDMVTLGLIDAIIQAGVRGPEGLALPIVLSGVKSGQRLAAANCAYIGARGLFRERGPQYAKTILTAS
jgi:fructokinase